jgi:hypothetical protein
MPYEGKVGSDAESEGGCLRVMLNPLAEGRDSEGL